MCDCKRPAGFPMCHCAGCHRWFTGPSVFAEHQTIGHPEGLVCHDPAEGRLVVVRTVEGGAELWGRPDRQSAEDIAALRRSA